MSSEHSLERAGADLRDATASLPIPRMRRHDSVRRGLVAFAAGVAAVLIVGIPAFIAQSPSPEGTPAAAVDSTTTTIPDPTTTIPDPTTTSVASTTTTGVALRCGQELPYEVALPEDFTGPADGPSPHSSDPVEDGQMIVHWLGRGGSVEIRWPANAEHLDGAEWGEPVRAESRTADDFVSFLFAYSNPPTEDETVGAAHALPTETMEGPCDAAQMAVLGPEVSRRSALFGTSDDADLVVYPGLPRPRDKELVVETLERDLIPEVRECGGAPGIDNPPPNKTGKTPDTPVVDTPEEALQDLLSTDVADTWPKTGYFELITPDGNVTYGNPFDDMSPDPRPENGLVISVTVVQVADGWTVSEWETSGC